MDKLGKAGVGRETVWTVVEALRLHSKATLHQLSSVNTARKSYSSASETVSYSTFIQVDLGERSALNQRCGRDRSAGACVIREF
jgi:hypothetical protein